MLGRHLPSGRQARPFDRAHMPHCGDVGDSPECHSANKDHMALTTRSLILFVATAVFITGPVGAQTTKKPAGGRAADQSPVISPIPAPRVFSHPGELFTEYDRFTDTTEISTSRREEDIIGKLVLRTGAVSEITFSARLSFKGPQPTTPPETVSLVLTTGGADPWGTGPTPLALLADGASIAVDEIPQAPIQTPGLGVVFQSTVARVPVADFLRFVNASKGEGRCWGHEFVLTDAQMEVLRDLASRMRPVPK